MASTGRDQSSFATASKTGSAATNTPVAISPVREPPRIPDHALLRRIGAGSYGEVWLARNVLGQHRAVKVVYRDTFDRDRPYEREFAGIQKFEPVSRTHEGHVDILHVGRDDAKGCFYYVMELADGVPEAERTGQESVVRRDPTISTGPGRCALTPESYSPATLKAEIKRRGALPVDECIAIGLALARALAHLHAHQLVHRDIKPSNIIFVGGAPKLADIGLVTSIDATRSFVGTDGYIPPEGPGTPQADLYSLGKVLYEMSTGQDRQDFPELPAAWRSSPERERLLEFNEVVLRAGESEAGQRYASAQQLESDLALLQCGQSIKCKRAAKRRLAFGRKMATWTAVAALASTGAFALIKSRTAKNPDGHERRGLEARGTTSEKAWSDYQMGRFWLNKMKNKNISKAIASFNEAIELDPQFALAYAGLVDCYFWKSESSTRDSLPSMRIIAEKLLALDNTMAEGHSALAVCDVWVWRWAEAEAGFRRAIALNENYAAAHRMYGLCLTFLGRLQEATSELRRAEQLDPTSVGTRVLEGLPFIAAGRYEDAIAHFNRALEMEPDAFLPHWWLAWAYEANGQYQQAVDAFEKAAAIQGIARAKWAQAWNPLRLSPPESMAQSYWHGKLAIMLDWSPPMPSVVAEIYARLGEKSHALDWLERAYRETPESMVWLRFNSSGSNHWANLRDEQRFRKLLRQVGFE